MTYAAYTGDALRERVRDAMLNPPKPKLPDDAYYNGERSIELNSLQARNLYDLLNQVVNAPDKAQATINLHRSQRPALRDVLAEVRRITTKEEKE